MGNLSPMTCGYGQRVDRAVILAPIALGVKRAATPIASQCRGGVHGGLPPVRLRPARPRRGQVLPTPTPVPTQGLSERARELAAFLVLTPTPDALPTPPSTGSGHRLPPAVSATVRTDGRPLNLRRGLGLTYPVLDSAPNGLVLSVTGRNADGAWLRVEVPGWEEGVWVYAALAEIAVDLSIVPAAKE